VPSSPASREAGATASVVDRLRRDIIAGALLPGTRITEVSLAEKYGVSRIPVRESLRALAAEGFVLSRPNAGSRVAAIPVDDADDLFAVRETLETATARRAAQRTASMVAGGPVPGDWWATRRALAAVLDEGDAAIDADDLDALPGLNDRFHAGVAELSGSATLVGLLRQLSRKIDWLYAADPPSRGTRLWPEHRVILAAIDAGDDTRSAELMGWHVRQSRIGYFSRYGSRAVSADA